MAKYLFQGSYTEQGLKGLLKEGGSGRIKAEECPMSATAQVTNGVNVDQLIGTINLIKENPGLAQFRFRAHTDWINGGHSRTQIKGFYGAGSADTSRATPLILEGDEPPVLLGTNAGPNAVEAVLHALASCLSVGFV
jgi:hypothetical protein